jgi:hypothetical protein
MDVRVYVSLQDAIDTAISMADLKAARVLVAATRMDTLERRALERRLDGRERELRAGEFRVGARTAGTQPSSA